MAALYEHEESRRALDLCDTYPGYPLDVARAYILAELEPASARDAYHELVRRLPEVPDFYPTITYPTIALLLGDPAEARRTTRGMSESIRMQPGNERWSKALLDYHCGRLTEEALLRVPRSCREQTCEAHFRVALTKLQPGKVKKTCCSLEVLGTYTLTSTAAETAGPRAGIERRPR